MNILCLICARKGSKGIKNKNMISINDRKLIDITINQAISAKIFNKIVVSTDSTTIQKYVNSKQKLSWFIRPKNLSGDKISKLEVIKHGLLVSEKKFNTNFDIICDLDVTAPLRVKSDIIKAYKKFTTLNNDILFSVCEAKKNPYFNMVEFSNNKTSLVKKLIKNVSSRQSAPKVFEMNASIYFWKRNALLKRKNLFGNNVGIYEMPRERSIDIDDYFDLNLVKNLIRHKKK